MNLANQYRPKVFADVVGQSYVVEVLKKQLAVSDLAPAILLSGPAGTGKTTLARIIARECGAEVVELDAASNNGVDQVRQLCENSRMSALSASKKVYIVDESHQMTSAAFNAFLKTLEEPPAHVTFILCTTDPQKLPATVLSRLEHYLLTRLTVDQVAARLEQIADHEGLEVTDDAFLFLAKKAHGGMRDAIMLLDMCAAKTKHISLQDAEEIVGVMSGDFYLDLLLSVLTEESSTVLKLLDRAYERQYDLRELVKDLLFAVVDVEKYEATGDPEILTLVYTNYDGIKRIKEYTQHVNKPLYELYDRLVGLLHLLRYETNYRPFIEGELLCLTRFSGKRM